MWCTSQMGLRRENVWSGQDFNRFDMTFTFDKGWFKVCPLTKSTVWVKYLIPYHWPYQPNRRDNTVYGLYKDFTRKSTHTFLNFSLETWFKITAHRFPKVLCEWSISQIGKKKEKLKGSKQISLMITSSSTRLLWMADQDLSGKCVSVVALPKSHSLIIPLELTSRFST